MLALLDAVTEIIKSRGGQESDTEYFCTLASGLDAIEDESTLSAVIPFVVMCIKKLSPDFLRGKFADFSKIFHRLLTDKAGSESTSLLRGVSLLFSFPRLFSRIFNTKPPQDSGVF
jgi:ribosomal RNA-processing protein 12